MSKSDAKYTCSIHHWIIPCAPTHYNEHSASVEIDVNGEAYQARLYQVSNLSQDLHTTHHDLGWYPLFIKVTYPSKVLWRLSSGRGHHRTILVTWMEGITNHAQQDPKGIGVHLQPIIHVSFWWIIWTTPCVGNRTCHHLRT